MMKKEKSRKKVFHMGKKTAKCSLVILSALVIHTAPTVIILFNIMFAVNAVNDTYGTWTSLKVVFNAVRR